MRNESWGVQLVTVLMMMWTPSWSYVLADISATDTRVAFNIHVVVKRNHNFVSAAQAHGSKQG
jgi:hypothetical protein